jgi:hypothetical protein
VHLGVTLLLSLQPRAEFTPTRRPGPHESRPGDSASHQTGTVTPAQSRVAYASGPDGPVGTATLAFGLGDCVLAQHVLEEMTALGVDGASVQAQEALLRLLTPLPLLKAGLVAGGLPVDTATSIAERLRSRVGSEGHGDVKLCACIALPRSLGPKAAPRPGVVLIVW